MALRIGTFHRPKSRVQRDFDHLLQRMNRRICPENIQTCAFYWFKTICREGYDEQEWKELDRLLEMVRANRQGGDSYAVQSILDLRGWLHHYCKGKQAPPANAKAFASEPTRDVTAEELPLYLFRFLNEWAPVEASRLLIREERECAEGLPPVILARAMERILLRERLSHASLELIVSSGGISPRLVYPGDLEILREVALFLLGRTDAPVPDRLPAVLMCVAPDVPLGPSYGEAFGRATLDGIAGAQELHVPIAPQQAAELLKGDHVRVTSAAVGADGELWLAVRLQHGERDAVVYRPAGRLRIDYSGEHAQMQLPWPDARQTWSGRVSFEERLQMFGREWRVSQWEQDARGILLHLAFAGPLDVAAFEPAAKTRLRRSGPASIDMAWAALQRALAASLERRSLEPVEQLQRDELIPLGRALYGLAESIATEPIFTHRQERMEEIERRLKGARYLSAGLMPAYGRVRWGVLPEPVRKALLRERQYEAFSALLREVFQGVPEEGPSRMRVRPRKRNFTRETLARLARTSALFAGRHGQSRS